MDHNEVVSSHTRTQSCVLSNPKPQQVEIILQSFVNFLQKTNNVKESRSASVNSVPMMNYQHSSSSMVNYLSYRKNVNERMSEISNNVSQMIIESCTSIDNICNKVRECLTDMHFNTGKINSISEISNYGMNEVQSSYNMNDCMQLDKPNIKNNEDDPISRSEVSVIESVHDDLSQSLTLSKFDQRTLLTPFFTIIQEGTTVTLQKSASKRQMLRAKNKLSLAKQMHKKTDILDAFKSALISNADMDEYEVMDRVVEDMNQEIARLSSTLIDMKITATRVKIETKTIADKERKEAIAPVATEKKAEESIEEKEASTTLAAIPYADSNPSLTEAILESEKTKLSESIAQLVPDVYRRPAVTDLHIKLLVQIEANDSYICFQRLMSRDCRGKLRRRKSQLRHLLMTEGQLPPALSAQKTISNSSSICSTSAPSAKDLKKKYADSLWFSDKQIVKKPHDKRSHKPRRHTGLAGSQSSLASPSMKFSSKSKLSKTGLPLPDRSSLGNVRRSKCQMAVNRPSSASGRIADRKKSKSLLSKSLLDSGIASKHQVQVINEAPPSPSTKYKMQCMRARNMLSPNRHLGYLDILDDLSEKDLLPLQSEYPRRDNITEDVEIRDVEDTYLYKILHGKYNSKTTWSHLIEPQVECSDENCHMCKRGLHPRPKNGVEELQTFNNEKFSKEQVINKLTPYLTDPETPTVASNHSQSVDAWPVQVLHDKKPLCHNRATEDLSKVQSAAQDKLPPVLDHNKLSKQQIAKKLLPYMTDPSNPAAASRHFRTVTALPVHVTYDNHQVPVVRAEQPTKMASTMGAHTKLPLLPMKEPRMHTVRGNWTQPQQQSTGGPIHHQHRPIKVVYDGLSKKPLPAAATALPNPPLPPPPAMNMSINLTTKVHSNSARCRDEKKIVTGLRQKTSRSFSPRGFSSYCSSHEPSQITAVKRPSKHEPVKQMPEKTSAKPQLPKKLNYVPEKRLPKNSIYGKSVQQKLVNFVERQTEVYSVPRPKYAQPPMKNQTILAAQASPTNQSAAKGVTPSAPPVNTVPSPKNLPIPSTKNSPVATINEERSRSIPSVRHKQMLAHLKGLKDKNDAIQSNIQKAINVIETKMVHILSTPGDSSSVEAFDDMEKEITNVLSMMKNQAEKQGEKTVKKKTGTGNHPEKIEEEFATISDELFKKLDQILDSEMSKSSSIVTTEHIDKLEDEGSSRKGTGKNFLSLSMTTTTSSEEAADVAMRRKKPHRKGDKSRKFSAVLIKDPPKVEPTADCSGDQKKETLSESSAAVKQETPAADSQKQSGSEDTNSKGDFADEANTTANSVYALENVNRSTTIESDKDLLHTDLKTEDIVSLNKIVSEVDDLVASIGVPQAPTHIPEIPEEEPETTSKQIAEEILQNLLDAPYIKEIPQVLFEISNETPHIPEHDVPTPVIPKEVVSEVPEPDVTQNHLTQEEPQLVSEQVDQTEIIAEHALPTPALKSETEKETADSFSDNVNKIIQRVEDIYSQLDDIQNTDVSSMDEPRIFCPEELSNVPRFKDESPRLPKIDSQEFLTPFMQAVKEKRTNYPESPKSIERSPSLYNVLTFLDTLTNIQIDKVGEVHIARLVHYSFQFRQAEAWFTAWIEHGCVIEPPPSCLKKNKTDLKRSKQKKVSFLVRKEDKESQVVMCPLHKKVKLLKVSSDQFPPIDGQTRDEEKPKKAHKKEETKNGSEDHSKHHKIEVQKVIEAEYEDAKCQHHQVKIPVFHDLENNDETEPYEEAFNAKTSNEAPAVSKTVLQDDEASECKTEPYEEALSEQTSNETTEVFSKKVVKDNESSECKTTTTETYIEEKSTQVYCHIEKASSKSCLESSDSSKASLDQPKVNIYIDNSDISIPKVISITDGAYGRETLLKIQDSKCGMVKPPSKVVVFREAIDAKGILRPIRNINQFKCSVVSKRNLLTLPTSNMVSGQGKMCTVGEGNKTFLKSFYAIVYIIMFTALNMEYRCV